MPKYGYVRVSSVTQAKHGNSLEHQVNLIASEGVDKNFIFVETYTGTKTERPKFQELLNMLNAGDTLVVTKLDRFARNIVEGIGVIDNLIKRGIRVHILNMGILDNSPASKLIRNIFLVFAEFERDIIIERTAEGRAVARQKSGYIEGRPKKFSQKQINYALGMLENGYSYKQVEELTKISKSTLIRAKKVHG